MELDEVSAKGMAQDMNITAGYTKFTAYRKNGGWSVREMPNKSQEEFYKEEAVRLKRINESEPYYQTIGIPGTVGITRGIPIAVSRETATRMYEAEQRKLKDAQRNIDILSGKYGNIERLREVLATEKSKYPASIYRSELNAWEDANKTIASGGKLTYTERGIIAGVEGSADVVKTMTGSKHLTSAPVIGAQSIVSGTGTSMKRRGVNPKTMLANTAPRVKTGGHPLIGSQYTGQQQEGAYTVNVQKGSIGTEKPAIAQITFGKGRGFADIPTGR